jgi:tRNA A-37 threonylcarbamoyl transferase component Bud32
LEIVHESGFTHNDLKLENIMVKDLKVTLIDYGYVSSYVDDKGKHLG